MWVSPPYISGLVSHLINANYSSPLIEFYQRKQRKKDQEFLVCLNQQQTCTWNKLKTIYKGAHEQSKVISYVEGSQEKWVEGILRGSLLGKNAFGMF